VQARNAAEEAERAAQAASTAKSAFLAMMSHELRTPLNAIGGYADLMELGIRGPVTPAQVEDLGRIRRNQQHLLAIINDILNLARIEAGGVVVELRDVRMLDVLGGIDALIGPQVAAKGLRYETGACPPDLRVRADREKLQQVMLNLISNAVRFTDAGGTVAVSCEAGEELVRLRVRDSGIGIPADKLESIFHPFVQVDSGLTRRTGGTGLGLSISRELTAAMGGRILVESTLGVGSTFTVELPRASEPHAAPPGAQHAAPQAGGMAARADYR
jgi:signal transduction histidine kinase